MAEVSIIGDTLHFDGYVVGRLSTAVPATLRERLDTALEGAFEPEEDAEACNCKHVPSCPLYRAETGTAFVADESRDEILVRAKKIAQAGLISLPELASIIADVAKGA